jgi:lysophospholipase L1-like esterase
VSTPYVALGDSYSAGVGAGDRRDACFHGPRGYPPLLAAALGVPLTYAACEGALVDGLLRTQLGALSDQTRTVTLTIGGNDAGFASVVAKAASPWWLADGLAAIREAQTTIRTELVRTLPVAYRRVAAAAPQARVLVATYPRLFTGHDCEPLTFFTDAEIAALNATADLLGEVVLAAAAEAGVEGVDVRAAFAGHGVCAPAAYVNGLILPVDESFHPTAVGHRTYARVIGQALGVPVPEGLLPAGEPGEEPGVEPGVEPTVEPTVELAAGEPGPRFTLARLDSPEALARAEAAGLDPARVAELGRRLDRWWNDGEPPRTAVPGPPEPTPQEVAAAEELRALSREVRPED